MKNIFKTMKEFEESTKNESLKSGYIEDKNIYICQRTFCLEVINLNNAMKTGKTCTRTVIGTDISFMYEIDLKLKNYLLNNKMTLENLIDALLISEVQDLKNSDFEVGIKELKGIEVFSPFAEVKALKTEPKRWNKTNITKAILTGQIYKGTVKGNYSDDYYSDGMRNYDKGKDIDLFDFAEGLINNGSDGWKFTVTENNNGIIEIAANHYTFSYNTLYFDINSNLEKAQAIREKEENDKKQFNELLESEVIEINIDDLLEDDIQEIVYIAMDENTNKYRKITDRVNKTQLTVNPALVESIINIKPITINPNALYLIGTVRDYTPKEIKVNDNLICTYSDVYCYGSYLKSLDEPLHHIEIENNIVNLVDTLLKMKKQIITPCVRNQLYKAIYDTDMINRLKHIKVA